MAAKISENVATLQLYITAWLTMNIKTLFWCIEAHPSNILEVLQISPCTFAARGQNPKCRHFKTMCRNFASK